MIWYKKKNENDIFVSTRVRLARNIVNYPFPNAMSADDRISARDKIIDVLRSSEKVLGEFNITLMSDLDNLDRRVMMEKHLVSAELISKNDAGVAVGFNDELSIMLMEEDHIRIQVIRSGFDLAGCMEIANKADDAIEEKLGIAFSEKYGYLTSCPTNTGTGIRVSVMMHLPALTMTGNIDRVLTSATKLGLEVRGLYGEGSKAYGSLYQISNRITLGVTEEEIVDKIESVTGQIAKLEADSREKIRANSELADRLWRSVGVLKYARKLSSDEAKSILSDYILGTSMSIIDEEIKQNPLELMVLTEPANIIKICGGAELLAEERDVRRAELVRRSFV